MKSKAISVLFACLTHFIQIQAQQVNQFNSWWTYLGNYHIAGKWYLTPVYSWNRSDFVKDWQQSLFRIGFNYKWTKNAETGAGYDWVVYFPYGKQPIPEKITEHRVFEQIALRHEIQKIQFTHTYRLEQRITNNYFRNRIRYRFSMRIPIVKDKAGLSGLNVRISDEIHVNIGRQAYGHYFAQNRLGVVFEMPLHKSLIIGVGYLDQYIVKPNKRMENNHTFNFELIHHLDFSGKIKIKKKGFTGSSDGGRSG